ncbi:RNA polymerase sigma-70 factor [Chitinophaga sp. XS-30]|uniref:RNA polymerase sigma-70 factor n=1 Tax=Chitinophaga sp. XS-30 TaxID=2604421 RepID=UPI0011DD091F|nr:RNA polymerase sigma-70 factor [Chitinophaga sp. XS-30]QEH43399.1 RNA polymerase sigma-70 factor [Chitinophaga sp. XS-30]
MNGTANIEESAWILRFRTGDMEAFEWLYNRYAKEMMDFAAGKLVSLEEARDIIHDLLVELWAKREQLHVNQSLRAYLMQAVRFRVIDHLRRNMLREDYKEAMHTAEKEIDNTTGQLIVYRDLDNAITAELDRMPPRAREIYRLSRQQHMSVNEIASTLNISSQTVKNQLTTVLKHLRFSLKKLLFFLF